MKQIFTIITAILLTTSIWAQSPEKMSYQAVIRNSSNDLITNIAVGMQISILQGSASGMPVYTETQTPTSNANGLVTIDIGGDDATVVSGNFSAIDWSNGTYFIKTETDPTGGTSYTITGTSQLLSVPYALHAKTAETVTGTITETDPVYGSSVASGITGTDTSNWNNKQDQLIAGTGISIIDNTISTTGDGSTHYVGELYGGGVIFLVDHTGQHGLIVSMVDLSTSNAWSNVTSTLIGTTNDWDGANNTTDITGQGGHTNSAAKLCEDYTNADYSTGTYSDWYLPSFTELIHVWNNFYEIQKALTNDGNASTSPIVRDYYWSSSEYNNNSAWSFGFSYRDAGPSDKIDTNYVRAVRAF